AVFGTATLRATAGDYALIGAGNRGHLFWRQAVGLGLMLAAALIAVPLRRLVRRGARWTNRAGLVALACLVAPMSLAILLHDPDINLGHAATIGTFGLLSVFLCGFALIGSVAAWLSEWMMRNRRLRRLALPSALQLMRFRETPVMPALVVWALLVGSVDHHE